MKQNYVSLAVWLTLLLISPLFVYGQIVGASAYMYGDNVEIGINDAGHEGAPRVPASNNRSNQALGSPVYFGFVANPQLDGWGSYDGDFFTPGTPENGFGLEIAGVNYSNNASGSLEQIPGSITGYTEVGDCIFVEWDGSVANVDVHIVYRLITTELYYTTEVTLTNTGPTDMTDVYYYRNLDPDNNITIGGGYSTQNTVVAQPSPTCEKALVTAEQVAPWDSYLGLGAIGENFRVSRGGFANRDASNIWNGVGGMIGGVGSTAFADQAISLAYRAYTLEVGTPEKFLFTTVLDATQIDAAIASLYYFDYAGGGGVIDECAPIVDTARTCSGLPVTISVDGPSAEDYVWTWAPPVGLSTTVGPTTDASPLVTTEYTVTGTPAAICLAATIEKTIVVEVQPSPIINITDPGPQCGDFDLTTLTVTNDEGSPDWILKYYSVVPDSADQVDGLWPSDFMIEGDEVYMMMLNTVTGCYDIELLIIDFSGAAEAGLDNTDEVCNNAGSVLDLNSLLLGADPDGAWSEISATPSGGLDIPTGIFTADDVDAGVYTFQYIAFGMLGCEDDTALMFVTVNQEALAGLDGSLSLCNTAGTTTDLDDLLDGNNDIGVWLETTASGQFDPATGVFDASGLPAGDYTFTYTVDAILPCTPDVADFTITILPNPGVDAGVDAEVCFGESVVLTAAGAGAGGTYIWDGGVADGVEFIPTETTDYTVTGTDANGCINTDIVSIVVNPLPLIDAGLDQVLCFGDDVMLAGVGAGVGGVYVWTGGVVDGVAFSPLTTEDYTVTGTDANGCVSTDVVNVIVNALPSVDAGDDIEICIGDGVVLAADGAGAGGDYVWTGGVVDGVEFSPIATAEYTVTGTDINACENTDVVTVLVNELPVIDAGPDQEVCYGTSVVLNGDGAGVDGSYAWSAGVIDGVSFDPIITMNYIVTGTDANGCVNTDLVEVVVNALPIVDAGDDIAICIGDSTSLSASGAGEGGEYVWSGGITDGVVFIPETTASYTVTGTDSNECENTDMVIVVVNALPIVDAGEDVAICLGDDVTLSGDGAGDDGFYIWTLGGVDGVPFSPGGTNIYTVTGTDINGCSNLDDVMVVVNPLPDVVFEADTLMGCSPLNVNFDVLTDGAGFTWSFGDGGVSAFEHATHNFTSAGLFDITLTVTSDEGCVSSETYEEYINIDKQPVADFYYSPDDIVVTNTAVEFSNQSMHADYYEWNFGDASPVTVEEEPIHIFPLVGDISYTVELIATNDNGCRDVSTEVIYVKDVLLYYVPNAFTPDGDSYNEAFRPVFASGLDIFDYHLMIFNRWGEMMFESYNVDTGWDGTYGGRDIVQDGPYIWKIEFGETMSDKIHYVEGHVNLIR